METQVGGQVEVRVLRGEEEVARILRPLHTTPSGPAVRFRRRLWRVTDASINIAGYPLDSEVDCGIDEEEAEAPAFEAKEATQDEVIEAPAYARLLVDAGPGTGKTWVACNRVAHLIREGMAPGRIWIVSFTRTAVFEIRCRLAGALDDPALAAGVRIATLDSHAWAIQSGFSKDAALTGSHNDNIKATLAQIRTDEDVQEYLERVRHLVIDEAQDIVGIRAELITAMIDRVPLGCGVTVFADRAQAIYGWTESSGSALAEGPPLIERLADRGFEAKGLTVVHRTRQSGLLQIFTDVRQRVLDKKVPPDQREADVREQIRRLADADAGEASDLKLADLAPGALILMRQRVDVISASSWGQETPHRLRMSGLPARILPWIGELLWDYTERLMIRQEFDERWNHGVRTLPPDAAEGAWNLMVESAGQSEDVIDIHRLRTLLGRSNPPSLFTSPDYGDGGPILGTVHASKGREADDVHLYLPPEDYSEDADIDEEIRVMFVGATRARSRLAVGSTGGAGAGNAGGRAWRKKPGGRVQVEVGRYSDVDAAGLVGLSAFADADAASAAQNRIRAAPVMSGLVAASKGDLQWRLSLEDPEKNRLCVLSEKVKNDLNAIGDACGTWGPSFLPHIRSIGLRTIVLRPDDPALQLLHEPWGQSGIMFAPMLIGFSTSRLGARKSK